MLKFLFVVFVLFTSLFNVNANSAAKGPIQHNGIVYFFESTPNKMSRYDMQQQAFMDDIALAKNPSQFAVDEDFLYLAFERELSAINLTTGESVFIRNSSEDITAITVTASHIHYYSGNTLFSVNKSDYSDTSSYQSWGGLNTLVASEKQNALFGCDYNCYDIEKFAVSDDGSIGNDGRNYDSLNGSDGNTIYLNASQTKLYTPAGKVLFSSDMVSSDALFKSGIDMAFIGDNPVVLDHSNLYIFDALHQLTATVAVATPSFFVAAHEQVLFTFAETDQGLQVTPYDVSDYNLPAINDPIDATGLDFEPEQWVHDDGDIIYMLDTESFSVFRWSMSQQAFLSAYRLKDKAEVIAYSTDHERLYIGYGNGDIAYFDINVNDNIETLLTSSTDSIVQLLIAGDYLVALDNETVEYGTDLKFKSIDKFGNELDSTSEYWLSNDTYVYQWDADAAAIYFLATQYESEPYQLPIDSTTGLFGDITSIYTSGYVRKKGPLVLSPDGRLLAGDGDIVSLETGTSGNSLSSDISAGVWFDEQLVTVDKETGQIQFWAENFQLTNENYLDGKRVEQLMALGEQLVIVTKDTVGYHFNGYDITDLPDIDSDGIHDIIDICPVNADPLQKDSDNDGMGDLCDLDNDNDGIDDITETAEGLDPYDATDAILDLDDDGASNLAEYFYQSEMNDASSTPVKLTEWQANFDQGLPAGFYVDKDSHNPWTLQYLNQVDDFAVTTLSPLVTDEKSTLNFIGNFTAGAMAFQWSIVSDYYGNDLQVYIDGEQVFPVSNRVDEEIMYSFFISEGEHIISFSVKNDYSFENQMPSKYLLSNFVFGRDNDEDGIPNSVDNCPSTENTWQYDSDDDGAGNSCDPRPYEFDYDSDGDQLIDTLDNCPAIANPEQADLDGDFQGDVCDLDIDGDWIDNTTETNISYLDPNDGTDGLLDQDNDGYSNAVEHILGTDSDNANQYPELPESSVYDFEDGMPTAILDTEQQWTIVYNDTLDSQVLKSPQFESLNSMYHISFIGEFNENSLSFAAQVDYPIEIKVLIDGEVVTAQSAYVSGSWYRYYVPNLSGTKRVTIWMRAFASGYFSEQVNAYIDNIKIGNDKDQDGIFDEVDNCPISYNPDQQNQDGDIAGDRCDPEPNVFNVDSDNDLLLGSADNCPTVTNPQQLDSDGDEIGDACDDDIDGDGISNSVENSYEFLDPLDPTDALGDEDSDGASNAYELNKGNDPTIANSYQQYNLFDYFPLGDFELTYYDADEDFNWRYNMTPGDTPNEYVERLSYAPGSSMNAKLTIADGCVLLTPLPDDGANYADTERENWCVIPTSLTEGGTYINETNYDIIDIDDGYRYYGYTVRREFTFFGEGTTSVLGETRKMIVLQVKQTTRAAEDPDLRSVVTFQIQLVEGIGKLNFGNDIMVTDYRLSQIDSFRANAGIYDSIEAEFGTNTDSDSDTDSNSSTNTDTAAPPANNEQPSSSGGGSMVWLSLLLLLVWRQRELVIKHAK